MPLYGPRAGIPYYFVGGSASFNPVDATNYYYALNAANLTSAPVTSAGTARNAFLGLVEVPGVINSIDITVFVLVTPGSTENSTFYLRQCIAATDAQFAADVKYNVNGTTFTYSNLGINVPAGEVLQIRQLTPTWLTNPTGVVTAISVYLTTGGVM